MAHKTLRARCKQDQAFSLICASYWTEDNQKSDGHCWYAVIRGCMFCLAEVELRQHSYQHDCVCVCVRAREWEWERIWAFAQGDQYGCGCGARVCVCIQTFPVWLVCPGCHSCRWQCCCSRTVLVLGWLVTAQTQHRRWELWSQTKDKMWHLWQKTISITRYQKPVFLSNCFN